MKKLFYIVLTTALTLLGGCSKDAPAESAQSLETTFILSATPTGTRAEGVSSPARYVMEVWSQDGKTAENIFENGTKNQIQITTGNTITVKLDKEKGYTCLFWADDNSSYNTTSLREVTYVPGCSGGEAFFAKVVVPQGRNPMVGVMLKRAVAKVTLTETDALKTSAQLVVGFSNQYPSFSVFDENVSGTPAQQSFVIKPSATTGTFASLYLLAKTDSGLSDFQFAYADEPVKIVTNIPIQRNFATNIKGEYTLYHAFGFSVTTSDGWDGDGEMFLGKPRVGDFLYQDRSFSTNYKGTVANPCIGIVFWVDPTNRNKGKIVSLDEGQKLPWGPAVPNVGVTDLVNGEANTNMIKGLPDWKNKYPIFAWCDNKNTPAVDGINWYIPARDELEYLYCGFAGVEPMTWDGDGPASVPGAKGVFNSKLTQDSGDGTPIGQALPSISYGFWSSSYANESQQIWYLVFTNGKVLNEGYKINKWYVRAISSFEIKE